MPDQTAELLAVAALDESERLRKENAIFRAGNKTLTEMVERLRADLTAANEDTSVARQSLYEVVGQRNALMGDLTAAKEEIAAARARLDWLLFIYQFPYPAADDRTGWKSETLGNLVAAANRGWAIGETPQRESVRNEVFAIIDTSRAFSEESPSAARADGADEGEGDARWKSVLDDHTCTPCRNRHGKLYATNSDFKICENDVCRCKGVRPDEGEGHE